MTLQRIRGLLLTFNVLRSDKGWREMLLCLTQEHLLLCYPFLTDQASYHTNHRCLPEPSFSALVPDGHVSQTDKRVDITFISFFFH